MSNVIQGNFKSDLRDDPLVQVLSDFVANLATQTILRHIAIGRTIDQHEGNSTLDTWESQVSYGVYSIFKEAVNG